MDREEESNANALGVKKYIMRRNTYIGKYEGAARDVERVWQLIGTE